MGSADRPSGGVYESNALLDTTQNPQRGLSQFETLRRYDSVEIDSVIGLFPLSQRQKNVTDSQVFRFAKPYRCRDCGREFGVRSRPRTLTERYLLPLLLMQPVRC